MKEPVSAQQHWHCLPRNGRLFLASGCGTLRRGPMADTLKIGAYSVVREVLHDGVIPAFSAYWKQKTGRECAIRRIV